MTFSAQLIVEDEVEDEKEGKDKPQDKGGQQQAKQRNV
jgi:hypothetical protein